MATVAPPGEGQDHRQRAFINMGKFSFEIGGTTYTGTRVYTPADATKAFRRIFRFQNKPPRSAPVGETAESLEGFV